MTAKIIKGEDVLLQLRITDKDKNPYDLTGKTVTVKAKIAGVLNTFEDPDVDVVTPTHGLFTLKLTDTITDTLTAGDEKKPAYFDCDAYITLNDDTRIVKFRSQVTVEDRQR